MTDPSHDRGTYVHPEDGKVYAHPSSLDQPHHIGHDGVVVYSPAQLEAVAAAQMILARMDADSADAKDDVPAFVAHVADARPLPLEADGEAAGDPSASPPSEETAESGG